MGITIESYRLNIGTFNNRLHTRHKLCSSTSSSDSFRFNKKVKIYLLCIIFIIITQNSTFSATIQSTNNKNSHITNGNIKATSIKIAHFNKGNSKFDNKLDDIHYIIDKHKPLIFSISEANYCNINKTIIDGYSIESCDFKIDYHTSRQILLIHKSLTYTRRKDLEKPHLALIICDIKLHRNDKLTIAAYYRQWSLPKDITINYNQTDRYKDATDICTNIIKSTSNEFILIGDDNIDTLSDTNNYNNFNNHEIKEIRHNFMIENSLISHHNKATFHRKGQASCLDHIYSNCHTRIRKVTIEKDILSDHKIVTCIYNNKKLNLSTTYTTKRDYSLITTESLLHYLNMTNNIDQVFNTDNPNTIAEIIVNEVNLCIETISPSKRIQCTKKHCKWYTPALTQLAQYKNKLHNIAKSTDSENDWRIFRHTRNAYNKAVKDTKAQYYSNKLTIKSKYTPITNTNNNTDNQDTLNNNTINTNGTKIKPEVSNVNKLWTTVKELTNTATKAPPRSIIHNNTIVTSLKNIANIACTHFINKLVTIRSKFTPHQVTHTQILEHLIKKPKSKFILPHITIKQTKRLIRNMKSSNSTGHDLSSIKIYKMINSRISPHITHLINSIINTGVYPKILKISRITPIKKPDKPDDYIDSYRPINNLASLEKIVEQHIKMHLEAYLCTNNIILKYHHGSRKFHGTNTAITHITNEINTNYENNLITATVATDLSAAFDTIDNVKLLDKLKFYGIQGSELVIFKSFLSERTQYVAIDTFTSDTMDCPPCSVVQGSKLSAVLYTIYTNEIPLLHTLMSQDIYYALTNTPTPIVNDIKHTTINYVDDSTSTISSKSASELQTYLSHFYKLLESYYNINYLKINPDKTKFIITCKPAHRHITKDMIIQAGQYVIKQSDKLKILGVYITSGLHQTPNVNNIISKVNHRVNILNKITRYTNTKTSLILYNSLVISVFSYCASNMINANAKQLTKLNVLLNKCTHRILGITSYRLNTTTILNKLNWLSYHQIVIHESIKLMHRISYESQPPALSQLLYHSLVRSDIDRQVQKPSVKYKSLSAKTSNNFMHRAVHIYNTLPDFIRALPKKSLQRNPT